MIAPKVSIIIPAYNAQNTLGPCLESVQNQNYNNYEIIVVDNNSTDETKQAVAEFQKDDARIKYVFEPKHFRGAARNAGIRVASGEIIAMIDADCIAPPDWLFQLTKPLIEAGEAVAMGLINDLTKNYWSKLGQNSEEECFQYATKSGYINNLTTANFAIKTSVIKNFMFDDNLMSSEDYDLYLRLKKLFRIKALPQVRVGHRHRSSLKQIIKRQFEHGYWIVIVYQKHKKNIVRKEEIMFVSLSIINLITLPFWLAVQFFKRSWGDFVYLFFSELSWRAGLAWSLIINVNPISWVIRKIKKQLQLKNDDHVISQLAVKKLSQQTPDICNNQKKIIFSPHFDDFIFSLGGLAQTFGQESASRRRSYFLPN
ncbi:MAG: glycosyltransferase [Patescibacteria group bacterium]|jgi:glycosyltransferase involved in cell wall biosynthesis